MLSLVGAAPAPPVNDSGIYFVLDRNLQPVECNRTEWERFQATGAATVAATHFGEFGGVVTKFEGVDDSFGEDEDPHLFTTMIFRDEHSEAEGHRTWHEAEAAHRLRVDEMKSLFARIRRANDPQLELL